MSRQAKIIIFSLILVFSIYLKQTKDNSISDDPTVIKQRNFTKEDFRGTIPVNKKIERKKPNLTPKNGFSPYDKYFGKGIYDNSSQKLQ